MSEFENKVLEQLQAITSRLDRIEYRLEGVEGRLDKIEIEVSRLEKRMDKVEETGINIEHIVKLIDLKLDRVSRWTQFDLAEKDPLLKQRGIA